MWYFQNYVVVFLYFCISSRNQHQTTQNQTRQRHYITDMTSVCPEAVTSHPPSPYPRCSWYFICGCIPRWSPTQCRSSVPSYRRRRPGSATKSAIFVMVRINVERDIEKYLRTISSPAEGALVNISFSGTRCLLSWSPKPWASHTVIYPVWNFESITFCSRSGIFHLGWHASCAGFRRVRCVHFRAGMKSTFSQREDQPHEGINQRIKNIPRFPLLGTAIHPWNPQYCLDESPGCHGNYPRRGAITWEPNKSVDEGQRNRAERTCWLIEPSR